MIFFSIGNANILNVHFNYRHVTLTDVPKGNIDFSITKETSAVGKRGIGHFISPNFIMYLGQTFILLRMGNHFLNILWNSNCVLLRT